MKWSRFRVKCPSAAVEAVVAVILEAIEAGPSVEDVGELKLVSAYLPAGEAAERGLAELQAAIKNIPTYLSAGAPLQVVCDTVADEDWEQAWKEFYRPLRVGRRLVIKPSWEVWPPEDEPEAARPDDLVIELDPEMAFGTGSHPSTQLCLCVLEDLTRPGCLALDVGCGSGILALAAAKLGAARVLAIDNDPIAVETALANVERNGAADVVDVRQADALEALEGQYQIIVANINAPVGCDLTEGAFDRLAPGGYYVASGLIENSVKTVTSAQERAGLVVAHVRHQEGWACVIGRKPDAAPASFRRCR